MCKVAWTSLYLLGIISSRKNKLYPSSKACTQADTSSLILVSISFWLRAWICNGKGTEGVRLFLDSTGINGLKFLARITSAAALAAAVCYCYLLMLLLLLLLLPLLPSHAAAAAIAA